MRYYYNMRTTLTIRSDIDLRLRKLAKTQNRSYKDVINEALAAGLKQIEVAAPTVDYSVQARDFGLREGIDGSKLNQLYDELETE